MVVKKHLATCPFTALLTTEMLQRSRCILCRRTTTPRASRKTSEPLLYAREVTSTCSGRAFSLRRPRHSLSMKTKRWSGGTAPSTLGPSVPEEREKANNE
jgi:hypothetical protein